MPGPGAVIIERYGCSITGIPSSAAAAKKTSRSGESSWRVPTLVPISTPTSPSSSRALRSSSAAATGSFIGTVAIACDAVLRLRRAILAAASFSDRLISAVSPGSSQ